MAKGRFQRSPYPSLALSESERTLLLHLATDLIEENFHKYTHFVTHENRKVDADKWLRLKTRDDMSVYIQRKYLDRPLSRGRENPDSSSAMPVLLNTGTFIGQMDDVMLAITTPTLDAIRVKAPYLQDLGDSAVLASIIQPTEEEPFRSVVVKWMQVDLPLSSTNLIKNRDFVYVEATDVLHFPNGERVGCHLMHSINFPETPPLPNTVRGNLSVSCCYRQMRSNVIDGHTLSTLEPGGKIKQVLLLPVAAETLLSTTKYVHCGQMIKLAWMLHLKNNMDRSSCRTQPASNCVACSKNTSRSAFRGIGWSTCKLCFGALCMSCRVRMRISLVAPDGKMLLPKITFCPRCVSEATKMDPLEAARAQARGFNSWTTFTCSSHSDTLSERSES